MRASHGAARDVTAPLPLSAPRRWLLLAITIAAPWLLLGAIELGLRVGDYGSDYPLFIQAPHHPDFLIPNPDIGRRYFGSSPFVPTPELEFFRAKRTPTTFRAIFQGESSAQGFPYGHGAMPSRILERRLQAAFPDREIEIVNTALTAITSHALLDQADDIIAQSPDAVLIYTGHNEYYGVFGAASAGIAAGRPVLVRSYLALQRLRFVQLMSNVIAALTPRPDDKVGAPRTAMRLMAADQRVPLDSRDYRQGLEQFRDNMEELLSRYRAHRIPVLIGTVASNERDQPPLAGIDSTSKDSSAIYYSLARSLEKEGDTTRARAAYREAKERDPLRFRAPEAINQIIRDVAARHAAIVVETQSAFERASPGRVIGHTLMLEHLHPNLDGYELIADAFHAALREKNMIEGQPAPAAPAPGTVDLAVTPLDSLVGLLRTDRLVSAWPFQPLGAEKMPRVDTMRAGSDVEQLAQAVVLGKLPWAEATERLRERAQRVGDRRLAMRAAHAMAQEYSYSPLALLDLADLALQGQNDEEALRYAREAMARQENARGAQLVGLLLLRRGDHANAVTFLRRATTLAPRDRQASARYRAAGALPDLEEQGARAPHDSVALYNLAVAYALTEQPEKARSMLQRLQRVAPRHAGARQLREHLSR